MLRIVYTDIEIVTVIDNAASGTTQTKHLIKICSKEEALEFFKDYPVEELQKIIDFV